MQVSMHEFKSHLSRHVSQAQSGQLIELTSTPLRAGLSRRESE